MLRMLATLMLVQCALALPGLLLGFATGHQFAGLLAIVAAGLCDFWRAQLRALS
jgi:hypothetical protein